MADLNALIAQGYKFQAPPDPFAQYAKMQQLDQGEQANQLSRLQMQEYQRGMNEANALRRLDPTSETYLADVKRINPKMGFEFAKSQADAKNAATEGQIKSTELLTKKLAMLPDAYRMADTPEAYLQLHESIHADPVVGPYLKSVGATPDKGRAAIQQAIETGTFDKLRLGSMQNVSQILESLKPIVAAPSASVYDPTTGTFKQAPAAPDKPLAPPVSIAEYERAKTDPAFMNFLQARAAAQRAPATPATPAAPMAVIDEVSGLPVYVTRDEAISKRMTPAASGTLKTPPVHAQKAITGGAATLSKLDETIKSIENIDATGFKGFLPDVILNRADPTGTTARANISDIGSLILHDRSGATITASETPRLLPFVPSIRDNKATVLKKLKRMRDFQAEELDALEGTYNPDQGYRSFVVPKKAAPEAGGTPPAGIDAALWDVMTPKERALWQK